jgi:hypothetical protein
MLAHAKCHLFTKPILHAAAQVKLFWCVVIIIA